MAKGVSRVAGIPTRCGVKARPRNWDGLPSAAEVRELGRKLGGNSRRGRCGRPGRVDSPEAWAHLVEKLAASAKSGRGLRFMSRDELDAVIRHLNSAPAKPKRKRKPERVRRPHCGWMP